MIQIQTTFAVHGCMDSRIGGRNENQDSCGFVDTPVGFLAVVCDGMGGMQGGSTASSLAVSTVLEDFKNVTPDADPQIELVNAVKHANTVVIETGLDNPALQGMGTTLTAVLINDECAYLTHVGDSRIYQLRGKDKVFRTFDHSMVFQMVKSKLITEEEARNADNSNIILKAIGVTQDLDVEVIRRPYDKNDRFVLCTDGFWGNMPERDFLALMTRGLDLDLVLERAFGKIERAGIERKNGKHDNLSCLLFQTENNSKLRSKMEKKLLFTSVLLSALLLVSLISGIVTSSKYRKLKSELDGIKLEYSSQASIAKQVKDSLLNENIEARKKVETAEQKEKDANIKAHRSAEESKKDKLAREKAEKEAKAAEDVKQGAEKDKEAAVVDRKKAEQAKKEAEQAKEAAEQARKEAEKAKEAAEQAKKEAECQKAEAEKKLDQAKDDLEKTKETLEKTQKENDNLKRDLKTTSEKVSILQQNLTAATKANETTTKVNETVAKTNENNNK